MRLTILKTFLIFCPLISLAKISKDSEMSLDTMQYYAIKYSIKRSGDSTSYFVNDQRVSEKDWQKYKISLQRKKTCNPCYLQELNADGVLQSNGVFYYQCPGAKEETSEHRTYGKDKERVYIHENSCKDGEWKFYDQDGKVIKKEYYNHGT